MANKSPYDYEIGEHVVLTHVQPLPKVPIVGVVVARYRNSLWVECHTGSRAGGQWPHMMPHVDHVKPAEWCEHGEHWGPGNGHHDYMCLQCRKDLDG